jgi:polar amino acid transport system substrate-binding protein
MLQRGLVRTSIRLGVLALGASLVFGACGSSDNEKASPTATPSPSGGGKIDISKVPELKDGKLLIGTDLTYPPIEFYEEGTQNAKGLDVDLAKAMGNALGVDVEFQQVGSFEGIVGDLIAKRYDVVWSAITINPERSAQIDFIPYFTAGTGILAAKGNPKGIKNIDSLCGLKAAAQVGTVQIDQMKAANDAACKSNPIDIKAFPDNPTSVQELTLGRVDANVADDPVVANSALESGGKLEVVSGAIESAPYGIGVRKDSIELQAVLEEALAKIMNDGTYAKILADWKLSAGSLQ